MTTNTMPYTIDEHPGLIRGESFSEVYTIKNAAGAVVNVSGAAVTIYLRLRRANTNGTVLWELSNRVAGEGEFVTDGTDGQVRFLRDQAATDALRPEDHDVEICYEDTSTTPNTFKVWGKQKLPVHDPATGEIV